MKVRVNMNWFLKEIGEALNPSNERIKLFKSWWFIYYSAEPKSSKIMECNSFIIYPTR